MNGLHQEEKVRRILEKRLKLKLTKRRLSICRRSDGSYIFQEFDLVSINKNSEFDGKFIGEVKSYIFGNENGYRNTRFCRLITACVYLQKIKAKRKMLILTNEKIYRRFKKDTDGLIPKDIEIEFVAVFER